MRRALLVIGLVLLAAACGPAGTSPDPVALRVMMADDWASTPAVIDVVREFERDNPHVTISLIPRPFSQIPDEARSEAASGTPLDVIHHHAFAAGAIGLAESLDPWWDDGTFDVADHYPGAVEDVTWRASRYGVPLDVNALFLVLDADLDAPRTFADIAALAADATRSGRRGMTMSADTWEVYGWIRANGGEVVEIAADGTPTFTLDSPAVVETLSFLGDLVSRRHAYGPRTRNVPADAFELFSAGETALLATGTWSLAALDRSHAQRDYRTAPMPIRIDVDGGTALGGSSLFVGRGSTHIATAVALIGALTVPDVAVRLAVEEGRMPTRPALYDRLPDTPAMRIFADQLATAEPMRLIAFPEATAAFSTAIDEVFTGRATAAQALATAQRLAETAHPPS